ncbi:MAG: tRNA 2-thiocytidine biosynthesis protein TtcA [Clostridia bacterium]|nr:tRNA 2-thiocytidine biosynthesis protein TtcA [Clostridia bacterium]
MQEMKRILGGIRRADEQYHLFSDGDKILAGISGGKDSLTLVAALKEYARFCPAHFELTGVHVDPGFGEDAEVRRTVRASLEAYCASLGVPFHVIESPIAKVVFEEHKEDNPCSLCARMRHRALLEDALAQGCNKIALGHHREDAVDTFIMNLLHEGRLGSMPPARTLEGTSVTLIRPMLTVSEKDIQTYAKEAGLPVMKNPCPADKHTERETVRKWLEQEDKAHRGVYHRVFSAMQKGHIEGLTQSDDET